MTTKTFNLTEEQRHALGSLIAHTTGYSVLDKLFNSLHDEFQGESRQKPFRKWDEITITKRTHGSKDEEIAILGKVYRYGEGLRTGAHDYILS